MLAAGDGWVLFLIIPVGLALAGASVFWRRSRSLAIIDKWAAENGYALLSADPAYLTTAFFFRRGKTQTVYSVVVRDAAGTVRRGKVLCGSFLGGLLFSDQAAVKWDD